MVRVPCDSWPVASPSSAAALVNNEHTAAWLLTLFAAVADETDFTDLNRVLVVALDFVLAKFVVVAVVVPG